jgi:hypothetical protein
MQQHAASIAFGDFAQPAPTSPPGVELDLARVLDRQYMTAVGVCKLQPSISLSVVT